MQCCACVEAAREGDPHFLANRKMLEDRGHAGVTPDKVQLISKTDVLFILRVEAAR
jgi:hypothetical protein